MNFVEQVSLKCSGNVSISWTCFNRFQCIWKGFRWLKLFHTFQLVELDLTCFNRFHFIELVSKSLVIWKFIKKFDLFQLVELVWNGFNGFKKVSVVPTRIETMGQYFWNLLIRSTCSKRFQLDELASTGFT